jgi:hypothetical protein
VSDRDSDPIAATLRVAAALAAMAALVFPNSAGAATELGETFAPPSGFCDPGFTNVAAGSPEDSYTVPDRGVITSWSYQADATPPMVALKILRNDGGGNFTVLNDSGLHTPAPNQLLVAPARIPVSSGAVLGLYTSNAECGRTASGYSTFYRPSNSVAGSTLAYAGPASFQLDVSAVVEPDCDNDGFGDESQDQNLDACPPGPVATITSGPKNKVKARKNRATATFTFTASEPDAVFNCALDGKEQFEPCVSPLTVTVRRGEHTFSVTAIDAGGNAGPAATDTWKVKRKRKRKK